MFSSLSSVAVPAKRHRGGQPGNQNAKGNRGNQSPLKNTSARKGGAPFRNKNARKKRTLHSELTRTYGDSAEAQAWIEQNAYVLACVEIRGDDERDAPLFDWAQGFTLDRITEKGQERKLRVYTLPDGLARGEKAQW